MIMRKMKGIIGVLLFGLLGFINIAHAALNDLGNGLVDDTVFNITWMKDGNMVKTSCDTDNALWQAFDPTTVTSNSGRSKTTICDTDNGSLNWFEAEAWIEILNAEVYLGHDDWRQPTTTVPDATCDGTASNCRLSELGHLFNDTVVNGGLENPNNSGTVATGGTLGTSCWNDAPSGCFTEKGDFENTQHVDGYWSGTSQSASSAWRFKTYNGVQDTANKKTAVKFFVWPVRTGLSVVVQQIPTLSIWGLGIMSLLLGFVARRKSRRI